MSWSEWEQKRIADELREIELIARSLQEEVGNESTLELVNRLKGLHRELGSKGWTSCDD
jgi:hypothetical protein